MGMKSAAARTRRRLFVHTVDWLEKRMDRISPVRPGPFFEGTHFPWRRTLEDNWAIIRKELDGVLEYRAELPNFQDISKEQRKLTEDDQWKTFFFFAYGTRFDGGCARCPETARMLDAIPGLTTAFFSILGPRKHIPAHRGPYKGVVRYHLGVKIPEPREACGIRVGGETAHWQEGHSLFFDDSHRHEAWNDTDEDRVVLFMDIVRPLPFPYSWLNRVVIRSISKSPFVRKALDNHDAWERRFEELRGRR